MLCCSTLILLLSCRKTKNKTPLFSQLKQMKPNILFKIFKLMILLFCNHQNLKFIQFRKFEISLQLAKVFILIFSIFLQTEKSRSLSLVYKTTTLTCKNMSQFWIYTLNKTRIGTESVSYTHLDVYKRQVSYLRMSF